MRRRVVTKRDETARSGANFMVIRLLRLRKKPEASAASSTQRHRDRRGLSTSEISSGKAEMASRLTTSDGFENLKFTEQKVLTLAVKNDANEVRRF